MQTKVPVKQFLRVNFYVDGVETVCRVREIGRRVPFAVAQADVDEAVDLHAAPAVERSVDDRAAAAVAGELVEEAVHPALVGAGRGRARRPARAGGGRGGRRRRGDG